MTSANGRNRRFRREGTDRVVEEEFVAPQAPDVDESGQRTEYAHVHDEVLDMEGRLRTFTTVVEEQRNGEDLVGQIVALEKRLEDVRRKLPFARQRLQASQHELLKLERVAPWVGSGRSRGRMEKVVIVCLSVAEGALAYVGLRIAVPVLGGGQEHDPVLSLLSQHGPEAVAVGLGLLFAWAQTLLGREIARASRGVFLDPKER